MLNAIFNEDCRIGLRRLPDNSIDCCVTSPPYFGLRDYGTAQWKGGDHACKHFVMGDGNSAGMKQNTNHGSLRTAKDICPECGAIRIDSQIGLEASPEAYIAELVEVFTEVRRVLKKKGTLWLNIGDSYNGSGKNSYNNKATINNACSTQKTNISGLKQKDLIGIPWLLAFALRASGWYLRQDIIWHKPNPMPESVRDRCTKSHEYIFLFSKSAKYYFDYESILEPSAYDGRTDTRMKGSKKYLPESTGWQQQCFLTKGHERWPNKIRGYAEKESDTGLLEQHHGNSIRPRLFDSKNQIEANRNDAGNKWIDRPARNKRDVWTVCTSSEPEAHFACFPQILIMDCIKAGCPENGIVLDPFMDSGTTAVVARKLDRNFIGFELNPEYVKIAEVKLRRELGFFQ